MKDALFIIICLLIIQQLQAQTIRDTVFNDIQRCNAENHGKLYACIKE